MKRSTLYVLLLITAVVLLALATQSQTYRLSKSGQIEKTVKKSDTTHKDKVYKVQDGVTYYAGNKGGVYYLRKSRTGKVYKQYLTKTK